MLADSDTPVEHTFLGIEPETIRWITLAVEGDAYVYRAAPGTRKEFTSTLIWLRASAPCTVRLLLAVEHPL